MVADLFRHLLRLPVAFFERRHTGDVLSRFGSTEAITGVLSHGLIAGVIDAAMAMLTLAMMIYYSPLLASPAVVALAIFVVARLATVRRLQRRTADDRKSTRLNPRH